MQTRWSALRLGLSGAAGAVTALAMNGGFLVVVGILGLMVFGFLARKSPARTAVAFGLGYFLVLLHWIQIVGTDAWIGLALLMTSFWLVAFFVIQRFGFQSAFAIATIFTSLELLRDRFPWGGFGWGQFGIWTVDFPIFKNLVPVLGQSLLTWLLVYFAFEMWRSPKRFIGVFSAVTFIAISAPSITPPTQTVSSIKVGAVQGGVINYGLGTSGPAGAVFEKHLETTYANASRLKNSDLVIWPESAVDQKIDAIAISRLQQLVSDLNSQLLINSVVELNPAQVSNQSQLVTADTLQFVYAKQRLVPFGEFLPLRSVLSNFTDRVELMPRDFVAGSSPTPINFDLPIAICFEIADDQISAQQPADQLLVVQTNNATYQNTNQTEQQLLITRFRALELQTPAITVATSGVSALIDRGGAVLQRVEPGDRGVIAFETDGLIVNSFARALSEYAPWLIWMASVVLILRRFKVRS